MAKNQQVRAMQTAQPFRPFLVKLADGRHFEVRHPENISCSPNGREMVVHDDDGMHLLEQLLVIKLVPQSRSATAKRKTDAK
ncbi:MAG: hypothetical protein ACLQGP_11095 [Isosphaeraceae bacterium]